MFETSLYVGDLPRSCAFYREVLGLELIGEQVSPDDRLAALRVGDRQ
ncbi:MAG TPA: VOC family protein [Chloroflexota bacterium]|nr:VOC family protein [Chloroflexota bacterium]